LEEEEEKPLVTPAWMPPARMTSMKETLTSESFIPLKKLDS
jgi:hypothetical protein